MSDTITALDLGRMFLGDQGSLFYVEILIRTLIIYMYTFLLLRVFGRRTKASMSIMDVIVIVALGSAVGDVAFYPEVPILHCLVVVTLIVSFNKALVVASQKSHKLRDLIEGDATVLIRDGVIRMDRLKNVSIGRQALLEMLREKSICNLGQIRLGVLEPSCSMSLFKSDEPKNGLSILPPDPLEKEKMSQAQIANLETFCCASCGVERSSSAGQCQTTGCHAEKLAPFETPEFSS